MKKYLYLCSEMNNYKKYKLSKVSGDGTYTRCEIVGLKKAYYISSYEKILEDYGGAAGLIKNQDHPGYCNLCMTYHSFNDEKVGNTNLPEPVYVVEFSPLYNEKGQLILIKCNRDEVFCSVDRGGYLDEIRQHMVDAELTFWNNGAFTEFK